MPNTQPLVPTEIPFERYDIISRWPLRRVDDRFLIQVHAPALVPGRQSVEVIDVTEVANRLQLNQGHIANGEVVWGPGEAYAVIDSEGQFVTVYLKDGVFDTILSAVTVIVTVTN